MYLRSIGYNSYTVPNSSLHAECSGYEALGRDRMKESESYKRTSAIIALGRRMQKSRMEASYEVIPFWANHIVKETCQLLAGCSETGTCSIPG